MKDVDDYAAFIGGCAKSINYIIKQGIYLPTMQWKIPIYKLIHQNIFYTNKTFERLFQT